MNLSDKELFIFDVDGTLTVSKSPMEASMGDLIAKLLEKKKVAIISGGGWPQFQTQFLRMLPGAASRKFSNLFLLPASGTSLYTWKGDWNIRYSEQMSPAEKEKAMSALNSALSAKYQKPEKVFGQLIEDRGSQITFSGLGQNAPATAKYSWDPDRKKREALVALIQPKIPEFDVRIGGATSIDITKRGVNKAYGIRKLEQFLNIGPEHIVFVGDALFYGGNDYPAKATGVDCIQVGGPEDTAKLIAEWVA